MAGKQKSETDVELNRLESEMNRLKKGELSPDLFKRIRLQYGVYSLRGEKEQYMLRVGFPVGKILPKQFRGIAEIIEKWRLYPRAHLTTRQDIQLYGVRSDHVVAVLRALNRLGLTTRETSGNVVRNVVCCPFAGVVPDEVFDVTPYAELVQRYFFRNPLTQNLPRKIKIGFEGCLKDHIHVGMHDLGIAASLKDGKAGFCIYVGGSLGSAPRSGQLLEPWTDGKDLLVTIEAVIRVFDRYGDRKNRDKARLKFFIQQWGWERFRQEVIEERLALWLTQSGRTLAAIELFPPTRKKIKRGKVKNNIMIRVPMGDLSPKQLCGLGRITQKFSAEARLTGAQNILLRDIPKGKIPSLLASLRPFDLSETGADRLSDVTRCRGAESCLSAITKPRGLVEALEGLFQDGLAPSINTPLSIKVSGCANSCSHYHIADIGLYGVVAKMGERFVPCYQILVGGKTDFGVVSFGQRLAKVPACKTPEAIRRIVVCYEEQKRMGENFGGFVTRIGLEPLAGLVVDLGDLSGMDHVEEFFCDLGEKTPFVLQAGKGECAA